MRTLARDTPTQGLMMSFALHIAVVISTYASLPFLAKDPPPDRPIVIDLVTIDEITAAPPRPAPPPEEKPEPKPEPEPVKAAEVTPPQPAQMPPPPDKVLPKEEAKAVPPKPTPPPPKPKPKPKKDEWADLQSLVKDIQKKENKKQDQQTAAVNPTDQPKILNAPPSDKATMTERDAIISHIEACWRIDPGTEGIDNLAADVFVRFNRDGSVQQAQIADMNRYFADSSFRTFANSARNAVLSCGKVPFSPERYESFKEITFTFRPQGRIN